MTSLGLLCLLTAMAVPTQPPAPAPAGDEDARAGLAAILTSALNEPVASAKTDIDRARREQTAGAGLILEVRRAPGTPLDGFTGMVRIPGGTTVVGTDLDRLETLGDRDAGTMKRVAAETPRREEHVGALHVDRTEVTQGQWWAYLQATGQEPTTDLIENRWPDGRPPEGHEHLPITNVDYHEAEAFLAWCGKRLLSEAEFARAARGDDQRDYPWGDRFSPDHLVSGLTHLHGLAVVDSQPDGASPYGVLGLAGNVVEWVSTPFRPHPDFEPPIIRIGSKRHTLTVAFDSNKRVIKGTSYLGSRFEARIDGRDAVHRTRSDSALGFRGARSPQAGLDHLAAMQSSLQVTAFAKTPLDAEDLFAREVTQYDARTRVIVNHQALLFAHRGTLRGPSLSTFRSDAIEEPPAIGMLSSTQPLVLADMPTRADGSPWLLPADHYVVLFKGKGATRALRREFGPKPTERILTDLATVLATIEPDAEGLWPGRAAAELSLTVPQDEDLFLLQDRSGAIVGWSRAPELSATEVSGTEAKHDNGRWSISFSLDHVKRSSPRLTLDIQTLGDTFPD